MRESCFRGKRIPHGEWVNGFFCKHDTVKVCFTTDDPKSKYLIVMDGFCDWGFEPPLQGVEVDPDTVGEFSGKHDKNDRRIFEGDIVDGLFRFTTPLRAVCAFKDGAFGLAWTHGGVDHFSAFTSICNVEYEVVGNIYDNPEMLEQEVQ